MPMVAVIEMLKRPMTANQTRPAHLPRQIALRGLLSLAVSLAVSLGLSTASTFAVVTKVGSSSYGVTPPSTQLSEGSSSFKNEGGHPVVSGANIYAIYWDPTDHYHGDWQQIIDNFLHNAGGTSGSLSNVFAVDEQYTDKAGQHAAYNDVFHGAYIDTDAYPTTGDCADPSPLEGKDAIACLTDTEIQTELKNFITQHSLTKGMKSIFYVLTPPGVTVCLDGGGPSGHCSDFSWETRTGNAPEETANICRNYEAARLQWKYLECDSDDPYKTGTSEEIPVPNSYENSFCSYHADISPANPTEGSPETILYATIPWTAGGLGDGHLSHTDRTSAYYCQDGGIDPTGTPIEQPEGVPVEQEPNQVGLGPDGYFDAGLADLIINQISVERQNIVTDPLLDAWKDTAGNELMDECRNFFALTSGGAPDPQEVGLESSDAGSLFNQTLGGGIYYLNDTFNLASQELPYPAIACINGVRLEPQFTAPNTVNTGELVGFNGMESDITLDAGTAFSPNGESKPAYATYTWNFGDETAPVSGVAPGAPSVNSPGVSPCAGPWEAPCAASVYHSYQYGGTYEVTLTVTDVAGNTASVTEPLIVVGPAPPSSPTSGTTPSGSTSPTSVTGSTGTSTTGASTPGGSGGGSSSTGASQGQSITPAPVLTDVVESTSLKKVKSSGLAVRYTVNEQVAGRLEVLLESATAKRLGIKGPAALGLAKGSPPSIVIGTAVLITTKAGQGTIRVKFSSKTAARMAHSHKLKLTLRIVARNASRQSPQTKTVLSTVVLSD